MQSKAKLTSLSVLALLGTASATKMRQDTTSLAQNKDGWDDYYYYDEGDHAADEDEDIEIWTNILAKQAADAKAATEAAAAAAAAPSTQTNSGAAPISAGEGRFYQPHYDGSDWESECSCESECSESSSCHSEALHELKTKACITLEKACDIKDDISEMSEDLEDILEGVTANNVLLHQIFDIVAACPCKCDCDPINLTFNCNGCSGDCPECPICPDPIVCPPPGGPGDGVIDYCEPALGGNQLADG